MTKPWFDLLWSKEIPLPSRVAGGKMVRVEIRTEGEKKHLYVDLYDFSAGQPPETIAECDLT